MKRKVITALALDLDGVINSMDYFYNRSNWDNRPYPLSEFDPRAVTRLNMILAYCDLLILVSSWRHTEGIRNILYNVGIPQLKVNTMMCSPYLGHVFESCVRGHELDFVIKNLMQTYEDVNYVILDDEDDYLGFQKDRLIQTSFELGLTDDLADEAINMLVDYYG